MTLYICPVFNTSMMLILCFLLRWKPGKARIKRWIIYSAMIFFMKVLLQVYNQIITSNSWLTLSAVFAEVSIKNMPLLSAYACASCSQNQNQSLRTNPWTISTTVHQNYKGDSRSHHQHTWNLHERGKSAHFTRNFTLWFKVGFISN